MGFLLPMKSSFSNVNVDREYGHMVMNQHSLVYFMRVHLFKR